MSIVLNNTTPTANAATIGTLPSYTYSNGINNDGVGAIITGTSTGALAPIDGWTPVVNGLILVMNEPSTSNKYYNNGLYVVTQVGSFSLPYILTRHITMSTSDQFNGVFVPVGNGGTQNKNSLWLFQNIAGTFTVGASVVAFASLGVVGSNKTVQTLTDGSTVTWDVSLGLNAKLTIGGNRTLSFTSASLPSGNIGIYGTLVITQDATGNRTLTLPGGHLVVGGGAGVLLLSESPNAIDIVTFYYDASTTTFYWTYAPNFS